MRAFWHPTEIAVSFPPSPSPRPRRPSHAPADGAREPALGCRTDLRRTLEAGPPRRQADHLDPPAHRAPPRPRGQTWATFLHNHAAGIWACDFLPGPDACFRPLFAFFIIDLATRRVVHAGATRHP